VGLDGIKKMLNVRKKKIEKIFHMKNIIVYILP
jgi:hypothetical protein